MPKAKPAPAIDPADDKQIERVEKAVIGAEFNEAARIYADLCNGDGKSLKALVNARQRMQTLRLMERDADEPKSIEPRE